MHGDRYQLLEFALVLQEVQLDDAAQVHQLCLRVILGLQLVVEYAEEALSIHLIDRWISILLIDLRRYFLANDCCEIAVKTLVIAKVCDGLERDSIASYKHGFEQPISENMMLFLLGLLEPLVDSFG